VIPRVDVFPYRNRRQSACTMGAMSSTLLMMVATLMTAVADPAPVPLEDIGAEIEAIEADTTTESETLDPEGGAARVDEPMEPDPAGEQAHPAVEESEILSVEPSESAKKTKKKRVLVPYAGVEFHPYSRQDAVWVDDSRTSGLSVGEFDGTVRPTLGGFVGTWIGDFVGLHLGLGVARLQTTTWVGETYQQRHWGVVRPSLEGRFAFIRREARWPIPWAILGVYVDIPSARDVSNAYSEDEQVAADETAQVERLTLWGVGGRAGLGVDYRLMPGIAVGAQFTLGLHQAILAGQDQTAVSSWLATEAAVLLIFEWPGKVERQAWREARLNH
jgi:hypothetical protein